MKNVKRFAALFLMAAVLHTAVYAGAEDVIIEDIVPETGAPVSEAADETEVDGSSENPAGEASEEGMLLIESVEEVDTDEAVSVGINDDADLFASDQWKEAAENLEQTDEPSETATYIKVMINSNNFPDSVFRSFVSENYDTDSNGALSASELAAVTEMDVSNAGISSLEGIEFFTSLQELLCHQNSLTSLDVSGIKTLLALSCFDNQLTSLDVSNNTNLLLLYCGYNAITSLDVSNNKILMYLSCGDNQLTSLDLSQNPELLKLYVNDNQLTSLDVSANQALTYLDCSGNSILALDVSGHSYLEILYCYSNKLITLDLSGTGALTELSCCKNSLKSLDVSGNANLEDLRCFTNQLTSLNLDANTELTFLNCYDNQLTSLNVRNNTLLETLYCSENKLSALDLSRNTALVELTCDDNRLTSLDVSNDTALELLTADSNQLTSLDVSNNTALTYFTCANNKLTIIDVSKNTKLETFDCRINELTSLDVSKNTALTYLSCYSNHLAGLDLSKNSVLSTFYCGAQTVYVTASWTGNAWGISLSELTGASRSGNVTLTTAGVSMSGGYILIPDTLDSVVYEYALSTGSAYGSMTVTLYPSYQYTVTFDPNGGSVSQTTLSAIYGTAYGSLPTPTRTGYKFKGWYTAASGGTQVIASSVASAEGSLTLYAQWTARKYTVYFDANGGKVTTESKKVTYASKYGTLPTPTRKGYKFSGWYTKASGGTRVKASTKVTETGSRTLYAHWKAKTYTVTLNANTSSSKYQTLSVTYGKKYGTLPTLTRTGYTFAGWYTKKNGGTKVTKTTKVKTAKNHTLYAHWTYSVTLVDGTKSDTIKVTSGEAYGSLPVLSKSGYTFLGWYTATSGGTKVTSSTTVTKTSQHTLYAQWKKN